MDKQKEDIGREIKRIAGTLRKGLMHPIVSGKVVPGTIDEDELTVSVLLTIDNNIASGDDEDIPTEGILLNAVSLNNNGVILYPADNSDVIVVAVDGGGVYSIIKCSNLIKAVITIGNSKVQIEDGDIQFNDGSLGGLTKTKELQTQLAKNNSLLSHLIEIINGAPINEPGSGAPSALQAALKVAIAADEIGDFDNIEDTKVTH